MTKMTKWVSDPWLGFDTETTGVSISSDRLVTAASVVRLGGVLATDPDQVQTWLADPGVEIPARATEVHGISTEYAQSHGAAVAAVLEEVTQTLAAHLGAGWPVVIFNAGYDLPLLEAENARHGVPGLAQRLEVVSPIMDPLVLDRALVPRRRGRRTLTDLCGVYGVRVPEDTHQAQVDAQLTLSLLTAMVEAFPQLGAMGVEELQTFQRNSHAQWAADFQQYLRSRGKPADINTTWF